MDYPSAGSGTTGNDSLVYAQWEAIHNPAIIGKKFQSDEDGAAVISSDPWVLRKYLEGYRWASVNSSKLVYDGTYTIKGTNIKLGDGKDPYPKLNISKNKMGILNVYPASIFDLQNRSEDRSNGLTYFSCSSDEGGMFYISVTTSRKQDLIDYLTCNQALFVQQINNYGVLLELTIEDFIKVIDILPNGAKQLFNATNNLYWILTLTYNNSEDYNHEIIDKFVTSAEKKTFVDGLLKEDCNITSIYSYLKSLGEMDIEGQKVDLLVDFLLKTTAIYEEIYPPTVADVYNPVNYSFGTAYMQKVFQWEETLGSDIIYKSSFSKLNCDYSISNVGDWLTIFNNSTNYMFDLKPFDYVGVDASNYAEQLPAAVDKDKIIAIPAFLLHYILVNEFSEQHIENIIAAADLGITLATLGAYAEGKTIVKLSSKFATGVFVDVTLQVFVGTLDGTTIEEAFSDVVWSDAFYTGADFTNPNWMTSSGLFCLRELIHSLKQEKLVTESLSACAFNLVINGFIEESFTFSENLSNKLVDKVSSNPQRVFELLKGFNLTGGNVQWLLVQIGYDSFDLSLKDRIDKALNEIFYESK
jgi:hypothetical protein